MNGDELRNRRIASFLQLAVEEREACAQLAAPLPRQALYFAQQAVEKILRAVLELEGIPAGASHNLRYLAELLPSAHPLKPRFVEFDPLSPASTRYRYPSASGRLAAPTTDEVKVWLNRIEEIERDVRALMPDGGPK